MRKDARSRHPVVVEKPRMNLLPMWGSAAQALAKRLTGSADRDKAWRHYHPVPKGFTIARDFHAVHSSGTRPLSAIHLIVLHDMEVKAYTQAAEAVGRYFEMGSSGGSTNYGVDNDSIQQYLADNVIPWGAPYANTNGLHIEQMGAANWSTAEWMSKAKGTLERTAWLVAQESKKLGIPIRTLTDSQVRGGSKGVTTHKQVTRVYGVYGGHTDPGDGYPLSYVLGLAKGQA
jgi:hypothetical protein